MRGGVRKHGIVHVGFDKKEVSGNIDVSHCSGVWSPVEARGIELRW